MKRVVCLAIGVSLVASAAYAQGGPGAGQPVGIAAGMQAAYSRIKGLLVASADKLSEADYAFKPTTRSAATASCGATWRTSSTANARR